MTGKVICIREKGKAVLEECPVPEPGPGEVLIENDYTVISAGTERANLVALPNTGTCPGGYSGREKGGFPFWPGYCGAGRIVKLGREVEAFRPGDRVIVSWGGHRTHSVKKAAELVRIDDERIDTLDASFAHIASFAFLGVRKLRLEVGESVMIAGQGILGVFALQFAALSGAIPLFASDFDPVRRKLALELGATAAFVPDETLAERVMAATGGAGVNAAVEVTGSAKALQQALEYIAWEGRISLLGCTRISDVPIDFYKYVHRRGITLIGAHTSTRAKTESAPGRWTEQDDYRTFLKLVAAGRLKIRPLISEIVSPERAPEVYACLADDPKVPLGIVFDWAKIR